MWEGGWGEGKVEVLAYLVQMEPAAGEQTEGAGWLQQGGGWD